MSKAALNGLTRGLARDLGPCGITVNVIHPGSTDTEMNPVNGSGAEAEPAFAVIGRYGTVDDIAAAVAHLAGEGVLSSPARPSPWTAASPHERAASGEGTRPLARCT